MPSSDRLAQQADRSEVPWERLPTSKVCLARRHAPYPSDGSVANALAFARLRGTGG
jgi:hypothetical protein